jgi:hypothetical protein
MGRALPLVLLVAITVFAVVEAVMTPRDRLPGKAWWVLGILLLPVLGPAAWFVVGRRSRRAPGQQGGGRTPPIAPDDDPDFLRGL